MPQSFQQLRAKAMPIKANVIEWSESLEGSGVDIDEVKDRCCYCVWTKGEPRDWWGFCFLKHGNEYFYESGDFLFDGTTTRKNIQDMKPVIMHNGAFLLVKDRYDASFQHIFDLEHRLVEEPLKLKKDGEWMDFPFSGYSFRPSSSVMEQITTNIPFFKDRKGHIINTEAYLHYIDGIAQNDSVKYHHKMNDFGVVHDVANEKAGRENCLLTMVNYIYSLFTGKNSLRNNIRVKAGVRPNPIKEEEYPTLFSLEETQ